MVESSATASFLRRVAADVPLSATDNSALPPRLPKDWIAEVDLVQIINGKAAGNPFGNGGNHYRLCQDGTHQRLTQQSFSKMTAAPAEWVGTPLEFMNMTVYEGASFMAMEINHNKYDQTQGNGTGFQDIFQWVPAAHDGGVVTVGGQQLHRWLLKSNTPAVNVSMELLVDHRDKPVIFSQNVSGMSGPYGDISIIYNFSSFIPDETLPELWKSFNLTDYRHPAQCPTPAKGLAPVNRTMYIFHPKHEFDIAGQDLGDDLGDTVFVCLDAITNFSSFGDHDYAWLTKWEIELVPHFGQYQNCNGYNPPSCFSAEHFLVGHDAAYYLGSTDAMERQCTTNPKVGEWYSLPPAGECKPGAQPGDGSCTWRKNHVKTIDGQCLIHAGGFKDSCVQERRAPFPESNQIFLKAFASDDPHAGGCPPISESPATSTGVHMLLV